MAGREPVQRASDFPKPPPGRDGWPWGEPAQPPPPAMSDGSPWPAISPVTPSFNQAPFIEETLRSVLLQGYPRLELVVIDGGSQDGTVEILRNYEPRLTFRATDCRARRSLLGRRPRR
ncbi:MAG: glycosyltransferase [Pirellulaceae bacterium]|nr:glycosyltransferase [Pirellulaceae bacterium]